MTPNPWINDVSERELQVLVAFCEAQSQRGAAQRLGLSHNTVRVHLANIRSRLGVHTTAAAVYLLRDRLA